MQSRAILIALGIYFLWGALLIAQKPGFQYDEAILVAGASYMRHPGADFTPFNPVGWTCFGQHCFPLMSVTYVGAVKEYLSLPLFDLFGPRTASVRFVSLLLGAVGIWGLAKLIREQTSQTAAAATALILAINPAYLSMVVFDNNAVGAMMAGVGLVCACLAVYLRRGGARFAFLLGAAIGFAVWARANFIWTLLAAGLATALVYRRKILVPISHWLALLAGGLAGGAPFLFYQWRSNGATWTAQSSFAVHAPLRELIPYRLFLFADTILSDGEHRRMWGDALLPHWQLWLFPMVVLAACAICLMVGRGSNRGSLPLARVFALALVFLGAALFLSGLMISEHHLFAMLPFAAAVVALACLTLHARYKWSTVITVVLGILYSCSSVYWNLSSIRGLAKSGGLGDWSDGSLRLARLLDQVPLWSKVKILDWGLQKQAYVLTDARLDSGELYWSASATTSDGQKSWAQEIREGGTFLITGPETRHFPVVTNAFLRALSDARPVTQRYSAVQRDGSPYAQIIDVKPNSGRGPLPGEEGLYNQISAGEAGFERQVTGFYPSDERGWRWTKRAFSIKVGTADLAEKGALLDMEIYVPEGTVQRFGSLALSASVREHALPVEVYRKPGLYVFKRFVPGECVTSGGLTIDFTVDHAVPDSGEDHEMGIEVRTVSVEAK